MALFESTTCNPVTPSVEWESYVKTGNGAATALELRDYIMHRFQHLEVGCRNGYDAEIVLTCMMVVVFCMEAGF